MKRKYEYAVTAGPGLLVDYGDAVFEDYSWHLESYILKTETNLKLWPRLDDYFPGGHTVIIGPVATQRKERK